MAGWYTLGCAGLVLAVRELIANNPDQFVFFTGGVMIFVAVIAVVDNLEKRVER